MRSVSASLLVLALTGCTLGLYTGEHYEKAAPDATAYDAAIAKCTDQMFAQPPVYGTGWRWEALVRGQGLVDMSHDLTARKSFSRACMQREGWIVVAAPGASTAPLSAAPGGVGLPTR